MKTHGNLYPQICSFGNVWAAAQAASRGRRFHRPVGLFLANMETEVWQLVHELESRSYVPGSYREKIIHHPKRRIISAAPFRDRVVHHAICRVVMPLFERKMVDGLYSNRSGRGTHSCIRRAQEHARHFRYVLKADVQKFFPSMDHQCLKQTLRRTIRCDGALWLLDSIVDGSNPQESVNAVYPGDDLADAGLRRIGLPIGNLTSQWFSGIYLTPFDHWITAGGTGRRGVPRAWLRYVDDMLLFANDKAALHDWRAAMDAELISWRLRLHPNKTQVMRTADGVTWLGQRLWPWKRRLVRGNVVAARRRLRHQAVLHAAGRMTEADFRQRWASWAGHAVQAEGIGLINTFRKFLPPRVEGNKARGDKQPAARRVVEQQYVQRDPGQPQQQHAVEHQHQQRLSLCEGDPAPAARSSGSRRQNGAGHRPPQCPSRKPTPQGLAAVPAPAPTPNSQEPAGPVAVSTTTGGESSADSAPLPPQSKNNFQSASAAIHPNQPTKPIHTYRS